MTTTPIIPHFLRNRWVLNTNRSIFSDMVRPSTQRFVDSGAYMQYIPDQQTADTTVTTRPVRGRLSNVGTNPVTDNATPDSTQDSAPISNSIHNNNDNNMLWEELTRQSVTSVNPNTGTVNLRPFHTYSPGAMDASMYVRPDDDDVLMRSEEARDKYHKELIDEFKKAMPQYNETPKTLQVFKEFIATNGLADITDSENQLLIELANTALLNVLKRNNVLDKEVKEYRKQTMKALDAVAELRTAKDKLRVDYERVRLDMTRTMMGHEKELKKKDDEIMRLKQMYANRITQVNSNDPNRISDSETLNPTIGPGDYISDFPGPSITWEPHLKVHSTSSTNDYSTLHWDSRPRWD